jgi:lysyl-tRNA synthetase class 1
MPSKLIAFSDDMDGLRKAPDNVPNADILERDFIGIPLCNIPDPFGTHESFSAHNNAMLREFLDSFGFEYKFVSSSDYYTSGKFDSTLLHVLEKHAEIVAVIAPTLKKRVNNYSPFMPIHPKTGCVMQVAMEELHPERGSVVWRDPDTNEAFETLVTGGNCKLQWKADWAMRWYALEIDYEMSGKDLIDSVTLSNKIVKVLGNQPPVGMTYELFLDKDGHKISKSKGNGMSVDEWLRYAPPESLCQFMFNKPHAAKRLYFDVIPRIMEEYLSNVEKASEQWDDVQLENPVYHIHNGNIPYDAKSPIPFSMLLNLTSVINATTSEMLWSFIAKHMPGLTPQNSPYMDSLLIYALRYYDEQVRPTKVFREPVDFEKDAILELLHIFKTLPVDAPAVDIQYHVYEVGKHYPFVSLRDWFKCLYQVLLGQDDGPRFGEFTALYGLPETIKLIEDLPVWQSE